MQLDSKIDLHCRCEKWQHLLPCFSVCESVFFAGVHLNWIYVNPLWNHRNWTIFSNIHLKIDLKASLSHFMVGYNQSWEIIIVLSSSIAFICKGNHAYWVIFLCCCSLIVDFFFLKIGVINDVLDIFLDKMYFSQFI